MSKDKYSDNHTIEVVGGELTVDADLIVTGELTVTGALNLLTGDLEVDDLIVNEDLTVNGVATLDDVVIGDTLERDIPASVDFNLAASAFIPTGDWSVAFTHLIDSAGDGVTVLAGDSLSASHSLAMIPHGCEIDDLIIRYTPGAAGGYSISGQVWRRNKVSGTSSNVASVTDTAGTASAFNVASEFSVGHTVNNEDFTYWAVFVITAPGGDDIEIHDFTIRCRVTEYS